MSEPIPEPPYFRDVIAAATGAPPGEVTHVYVRHDRDCALLCKRGGCTCKPLVAAAGQYVLWFRPKRGRPWEAVAAAASAREAWDAVTTSGRKGGDWLTLPADKEPN